MAFANGMSGKVDLSSRLFGSVFEPLRDPSLFSQVRLDEYGAVCWPNGADLAPDEQSFLAPNPILFSRRKFHAPVFQVVKHRYQVAQAAAQSVQLPHG